MVDRLATTEEDGHEMHLPEVANEAGLPPLKWIGMSRDRAPNEPDLILTTFLLEGVVVAEEILHRHQRDERDERVLIRLLLAHRDLEEAGDSGDTSMGITMNAPRNWHQIVLLDTMLAQLRIVTHHTF